MHESERHKNIHNKNLINGDNVNPIFEYIHNLWDIQVQRRSYSYWFIMDEREKILGCER